jgi:hypothetical protein
MEKLLFVYNADSGLLNGLKDLLHKNISPQTYACRLCAVTYDNFGMISDWRKFWQGLGKPVEFLHRDELAQQYGLKEVSLPAAFIHSQMNGTRLWLDAEAMNHCQTLDDLKELVQKNIPR